MLKIKNSIGLKTMSFLVQGDEILYFFDKLLTKVFHNAIMLSVSYMYLKIFLPHNSDYVVFLF